MSARRSPRRCRRPTLSKATRLARPARASRWRRCDGMARGLEGGGDLRGTRFVAGLLQPASALAEIVGIGTFSDRLLPPASKAASDCRPAACVAGLAWSRYAE